MKTILATLLTVLFLLPVPVFGEIQTITHTVKQSFGGSQSPDDARISAVAKAKREALEMAGTYIETLTVVKNYQVDKDEVLALSAGVLKAEVVSQKNYASEDAFGIDVVVKVLVDTSVLEERVKKLLQDRTHLDQLNQARLREKELLEKISALEGENRKSGKTDQQQASLKKEFQDATQGLTAVDWVDKALALYDGEKLADPKKAIEYLNEAIRLQPDYGKAYGNRGLVYANLGQHQRAIQDYDIAIRLKPETAEAYAYGIRGLAYANLGQHQRAIQDYDTSIRLKPDTAEAYGNRGIAYANLGQYQRAIQDYDAIIRLRPDDAVAYYLRGNAYANLGKYQRGIQDYNMTVRLKPDFSLAYNSRGNAYANLRQYQQAIRDYNEAILLKQDDADTYINKGNAYAKLGKYQRAIKDYDMAIRIKPDDTVAYYNRGVAYNELKQYKKAIQDYNEVIRFKPDDVDAYINRGLVYIASGRSELSCHSFIRACELGKCDEYELRKQKGYCR